MNQAYTEEEVLLRIEGVSKSYGDKLVLKQVSATIKDIKVPGKVTGQIVGFIGPSGIGKCLGAGTPVLMYDGSVVPVEDVQPGDLLMGPDSEPREVQNLSRGIGKLYEVTPVKGMPYVVNEQHILAVVDGTTKQLIKREISVADYLKKSKWFKQQCRGYRTAIAFQNREVPIEPYFLGLWLGDGHSANTRISTADPEIVEFLQHFANMTGAKLSKIETGDSICGMYCIHNDWGREGSLLRGLRDLGVLRNKHIPMSYKINGRYVRRHLLAGLMDTDGEYLKSANCFTFTSALQHLAEDVAFIARSLGLAAYVQPFIGSCHYKGRKISGLYFKVIISGNVDMIPTRIARKRPRKRQQAKNALHTGINIKEYGTGQYFGFELSGDGLFVLGDFTVAHNSTLFRIMAGLEKPSSGRVVLDNQDHPVEAGQVGVVAQNYPLFAHRTVYSNLMLAAKKGGKGMADVINYMTGFDLMDCPGKYPAQLSGGQRQRCAILQQVLCGQSVILYDEPFSGLDPIAKRKTEGLIQKIANLTEVSTAVIVTHDIRAAIAVSDHLWLLGRGRDAEGKVVPGAYIVETVDLIARDLAWHPDIRTTLEFAQAVVEIEQKFVNL